ncbi:DNRLRE domain-containing protein [Kitasatospora herbaricolor]|uniref:DNRLRE domain-containing protein n=2 Tax=Kitasatospora herbaricolor TaxID=68217 RepID=A0ABZ1WKX0_9ACTN
MAPVGLRALSGSLAFAVAISLLAGSEVAFAAPPTAKANGKNSQNWATTAADIPSARVAARLSGQRVEALSERSETSTTWVNKDGSLTTDLAAGPIRFQRDGQWVDIDLDLQAAPDGSVASKAHPRGLKLAGAGGERSKSFAQSQAGGDQARTLVTLGSGDDQIELQWKGGLPKPVLDGTKATYRDALADGAADLVVEATRTGFEQFVNLKQRPTAAGYTYTMPLRAPGLKAQAQDDGSVLFTDAKSGEKRAVLPAPVMWDASGVAGSSEHPRQGKVDLKVVQRGADIDLVFTPDAKFLADPATKYPVTVDPSTAALGNAFDTRVQQGETVDWSADTELYWGNSGTKNADGSSRQARAFINWNTAPIADALVSSATLSLYNFHSGNSDCLPYTWEVWNTGLASTASRWTAQPAWNSKQASPTETKGRDACGGDGWITADVKNLVQTWASAKSSTSGMGLRAPDETNTKYWKEVNSANAATNVPKLTVTYNYRPRTGTDQQAGSPFAKDAAGTWWVNSTTPTLRDTFVDPNNDKVDGTFQIFDSATDTQVGNVLVSPYVPSGQPASVTVPAGVLTNGKTYKFRTSPYDGTNYNVGWSPWATFTVDASAPSAPSAVTSTDYPSASWVKGAGQPGAFTVTPPAGDQNAIEWSLDGTTWTKVATSGTTPVTINVTPAKAGTNVLKVRASDRAENKSEALSYTFHVGPGGVTTPDDGTRTAARLPLAAEADGAVYDKATFSWRRGDTDAWAPVPAADVTNAGQPLGAWPATLTNGKSPVLTWNATTTVNPDGNVQLRADFTGPGSAATSSDPISVVVDRNADGAAREDVGPGSLNLLTGDLRLTGTDASVFGMSVNRSASSRTPQAGAAQEGQAPIFGKEWVSGTIADSVDSKYTEISKTSATSLNIGLGSGASIKFTAKAGGGWTPETGAERLTLTGSFTSGDFVLSDPGGIVTTFKKVDPASTSWTVSSSLADGLDNAGTKQVSEAVTVGGKTLARPKRIIAPSNATTAAACEADPTVKGCRVLEFVYANTTTATGTSTSGEFGDFTGQVSQLRLWATAPGAAASTATAIAQYRYDSAGRLRQSWDPRISQSSQTQYAYDGAGHVVSLQPQSLLPWTLTYGQAGSNPAAGDGMLLSVSRATLAPGSAHTTNGTATTTVVYGVPVTGSGAPEDLGAQAVAAWGQTSLPTDATAVFPADQVPSSNNGTTLGAGSYGRASITYLDASGRSVNQADPGHHIATAEFDRMGNTVRSLTPANRELALGTTPAQLDQLTALGINTLSSAERAQWLSTTSAFSVDGLRETDTYLPLHQIALTKDMTSGSTTLAKAGTQVAARQHNVSLYDQGRPTDGTAKVKDQVTMAVTGAQPRSWPDLLVETRQTQTVVDWTRGLPTAVVKDSGGLALTTTTSYDSQGRVTANTLPASNGSDAGATFTTYYSATGTGTCANRPEWADLVCQTGPSGAVTGGGTNPSQLVTKTFQYGLFGQIAQTAESANGVTRTTVTTPDAAGRPETVTVTDGLGTAVPAVTTTYDPATGQVVKEASTGATITKAYDDLGRLISYTDGDGGTTATEYDALGRPTKVTDGVPTTTTYTYDTAIDPRGLATSTADSVAGTFTARYDGDGTLVTQGLPGGFTMTETRDPAGPATARTYTRDSDATVVVSDRVTTTAQGQWATHAGTPGVTAAQNYTYDGAGRLTQVQDTSPDAVCTTRSYTYDKNSNRSAQSTAVAGVGLDCTTSGATNRTYAYDSADRLVDAGYTYDAFGRTTALPGTTAAYFTNDLVQRLTTGSKRQTWTVDPANRLRTMTGEDNVSGTWTQTSSKVNHYAADTDSPRWITEDTAGTISRNVQGPGGGLAATSGKTGGVVLQLTNLHGDVVLALPADTAQAPTALDADEYGNTRQSAPAARYGWLGAPQRSAETVSGVVLMGVRLYNPSTGRFLSTDPVAGGNANAYEYCHGDPVNCTDLDGRWSASRTRYYSWGRISGKYWSPGGWGTGIGGVSLTIVANRLWTYRIGAYGWYSYLVIGSVGAIIAILAPPAAPAIGIIVAAVSLAWGTIQLVGQWSAATGRCLGISAGASIYHKWYVPTYVFGRYAYPWRAGC